MYSSSVLERLKREKIFVDIHRDGLGDILFGQVIAYSDQFILLRKINDGGEYDGYSVVFNEDISRLQWDGTERKSIEKLVELKGEKTGDMPDIEVDDIKNVLTGIQEEYGYVSLYTEPKGPNACFVGQLVEIFHDSILLHEFGPKNSLDRSMLLIKSADISRIDFDGKYEKDLLRLHSIKENRSGLIFRE